MSETIYFWKTGEVPYGVFSNWAHSPFQPAADPLFPTAEHYIMWCKADLFRDAHSMHRIAAAVSPAEAKAIGRRVQGFDDAVWQARRDSIAMSALRLKFRAHPDMLKVLLDTGDAVIAEASPVDRIWGIGIDADSARAGEPWRGENVLGKALMKVREEFRALSASENNINNEEKGK